MLCKLLRLAEASSNTSVVSALKANQIPGYAREKHWNGLAAVNVAEGSVQELKYNT